VRNLKPIAKLERADNDAIAVVGQIQSLKNFKGLVAACIQQQAPTTQYTVILNAATNGIELTKLIVKEIGNKKEKDITPLDKDLLRMAKFFSDEKNYKKIFEAHPVHSNSVPSNSAAVTAVAPKQAFSTNQLAMALANNNKSVAAANIREGINNSREQVQQKTFTSSTTNKSAESIKPAARSEPELPTNVPAPVKPRF
jgi:hypothetical protein